MIIIANEVYVDAITKVLAPRLAIIAGKEESILIIVTNEKDCVKRMYEGKDTIVEAHSVDIRIQGRWAIITLLINGTELAFYQRIEYAIMTDKEVACEVKENE